MIIPISPRRLIPALLLAVAAVAQGGILTKIDSGQHVKVVCYGTSITAGGSWVNDIRSWLNNRGSGSATVINAAQSGSDSVGYGMPNFSAKVLAENPDALIVEFCINDADPNRNISVATSKANIQRMIDELLARNPQAQIFLMITNPVWNAPNGFAGETMRPNLAGYYQGYRELMLGQPANVRLIDQAPIWANLRASNESLFRSYVFDGIHVTDVGNSAIVTPFIKDQIQAAETVPTPTRMPTGGP